jgi:hypothetical protein
MRKEETKTTKTPRVVVVVNRRVSPGETEENDDGKVGERELALGGGAKGLRCSRIWPGRGAAEPKEQALAEVLESPRGPGVKDSAAQHQGLQLSASLSLLPSRTGKLLRKGEVGCANRSAPTAVCYAGGRSVGDPGNGGG